MNDYCNYEVLKNDLYGRYAVAASSLEPGDLITSEVPFTFGPKSDSPPICLGCHRGTDCQTMCTTCGWPVCSVQCEKQPIHSDNECMVFSQAKIRFRPVQDITSNCPQYECITPLRVLLTKERYPEIWEKDIQYLESHEEQRKKTEYWGVEAVNIVGFLHKVCRLHRFSEDLIHFVCGVLDINAFVAPVSFGHEVRCLYPKTSLLTHSCAPNVGHCIFSRGADYRILVRAMVKIEKGHQLLLSYTQTLLPTMFRRNHLKESKFFDCVCPRCEDPTELETNLSTLKCTKCEGWVLSTNSLDESASWKCTCCDFTTKGNSIMNVFGFIQKEIDELNYSGNSDPVALREAFLKKYKSVLHPNHALLLTVKSSLTQLYGKAEGYQLDDLPDILLERKLDFCRQINLVSNKIKPGLSRQRGWNLYEMYAPLVILSKHQYRRKEIDGNQLKRQLEEAAEYLEEAALIFSYDNPDSPEGYAGKLALQTLKELKAYIETL